MTVRRLLAPLLVALAVAACSGDGPGYKDPILGGEARARIRVANATTSIASAQLYVGNDAFGNTAPLVGFALDCFDVPLDQPISFRATGATATLATLSNPGLASGRSYTVVLYGRGSALQIGVLSDDAVPTLTGESNGIRFFNTTSAAGDVYLTTPDIALPATPTVSALAVGQSTLGGSAFGTYPIASTLVRFYDVGVRTGIPRITAPVSQASLSDHRTWTFMLSEEITVGNASVSFLVPTCPTS